MSDKTYDELGKQMKAMKRERAKGMTAIRGATGRIRSQTNGLLSQAGRMLEGIGKANAQRSAETRQNLAAVTADRSARTQADMKARAEQIAEDAARLGEAIRKSVADLKDDARQIRAQAERFLADTRGANQRLRTGTRRALSQAHTTRKAQWRQDSAQTQRFIAGIRKDVASLRSQSGQIVAEAASMLGRFTEASHQRASAWQEVVQDLRQMCLSPSPAGPVVAATAPKPAARKGGKAKHHAKTQAGRRGAR